MLGLYVGQELETLKFDFAVIVRIENDMIRVKYKGKYYDRSISIIGKTLFISDKDQEETEHLIEFIKNERQQAKTNTSLEKIYLELAKQWPSNMQGCYNGSGYYRRH